MSVVLGLLSKVNDCYSVLLLEEIPKYPMKTTDLLHVTDKLYHKVVSSTPCHEWHSKSQL